MNAMFGKKKEPLFGDHIEIKCEYCANGREAGEACRLNLRPEADGTCRRFAYDPLRRSPKTFPPMRPHDAEEFKL
jgi:hypothetical protein